MPAEFLPTDSAPSIDNRGKIEEAIDAGYVVMQVAGNGGISLDPLLSLMPVNQTGSIMVGSSNREYNSNAFASNVGDRVDANGGAN